MSKAKKAARSSHRGPGPLGAWRLTLAVGSSALLTGRTLLDSAMTGEHLDLALGRSFGAACVVWIAAGQVNRIFVDVEHRRQAEVPSDEIVFDDDSITADHGDSAHLNMS
jgi:hypothetical protein